MSAKDAASRMADRAGTALEQAKSVVLDALRQSPSLTIPQIQERWSRSAPYLYWAVDALVEQGLVVCAGWAAPRGHTTRTYKLNPARAPQISSETRAWMSALTGTASSDVNESAEPDHFRAEPDPVTTLSTRSEQT